MGISQGINTIVIDPGHGGKDHGCSGDHSIEKHVTLDIAYKLKRTLNETLPHLTVEMTRRFDVFIPLERRCAFANKLDADLFISIHCNQIDIKSVNGTETFVLGETSDRDIKALLTREQTPYQGQPHSDYGEHLDYILAQAYHQQNLKESIQMASLVMEQISQKTDLKKRKIKQANFKVLKGLYMPGILIETGFLSNIADEDYLLSNRGQYHVAQAISGGVENYIKYNVDYHAPQIVTNTTSQSSNEHTQTTSPSKSKYGIIIATTIGEVANVNRPEWKYVTEYEIYKNGATYYHITGNYTDRSEAQESLIALQLYGFKGAYIHTTDQFKSYDKVN